MAALCAQCGGEIGYADRGCLDHTGEPVCRSCHRELLLADVAASADVGDGDAQTKLRLENNVPEKLTNK